ncbi:serine/threonine protein kinase [Azospirillum sp. RWY-5-1]|uniref:Serine/threonine protein kinase n=1 Tax=Azospirillum oleiclasticum TaxID=2735135 RepID=A0ABX2T9Y0_9PROT|nr:serine/threonine protein kinase [Azospirillum oleiclasticum]NYZ21146.1 serine/threonine protein kinase [Azospirillum oleiclasticum]
MTIPPSPSSAGSFPAPGSPPDPAAYHSGADDADSTSQTPAGPPAVDALAFDDDTVRVGDTLKDRFILKEFLGAGGMGKVFKALDLRKEEAADRNPYVAVKVLKERMAGHSASIIALQREARKAQELSHPNIIKVYDFDRDGFRFFITMEYLTGRSLDRIIRSDDFGPMTQPEAAGIVGAVGAALSFAHANGFLHWDLKPGNIFVTDKGRVKVIDFGLSRAFKRAGPAEDATVADVTNFDIASLGGMTPAYASPEMIETQTADPRGDVFSLACITYELLTGRHPFGRIPSTHARDANIRPQRIPSLRNGQWQALERALAFDPKKRTDSVDHFLVDLALDRVALSRRPLPVVPMLAAAVLAVAGVGAWLALSGGAAPTADVQTATAPTPISAEPVVAAVTPPAASPAPAPIPAAPAVPAPAPEPPGTEHARALFGNWCGSAFKLTLTPARWTYILPNGSESVFTVQRYDVADGRLSVSGTWPDGLAAVSDFGSISADHASMVQVRARFQGDAQWRDYNRPFHRC